ncbi:NB-ARC domains-containing protein [Tanacetum coccineum]
MFVDIACALIGENKDVAASVIDSSNCFANAIFEVLVNKFLITVSANNMSLQMHELIQSMAMEILREESSMPGNQSRLWISSEDYDVLNVNKVTEEVEVLIAILAWNALQFLPSAFNLENIVPLYFSYSHIKHHWTTPMYFKRLKIMKLRHCCNLTTTPDFSEITNLEELNLEGCVNLVIVYPSIGMLKRLVVLNMRNYKRLQNFPCRVEMNALEDLNLLRCLNANQLPKAFWYRWWTSIPGFIWNQQHPQRPVSLEGLHMLKKLYLGGNNLVQVPNAVGGISCLNDLYLKEKNFTSLPGCLSQLSHLERLYVDGCKKLEVLLELAPSVRYINASDCTSLKEVWGLSKDALSWYRNNDFRNCPNLFKNVTIDRERSILKTYCLDSPITSQGFIHQLSAFLGYFGIREFFLQDDVYSNLDIVYQGNSIPE